MWEIKQCGAAVTTALSSGARKMSSIICNVGPNPLNLGSSYTPVKAIPS